MINPSSPVASNLPLADVHDELEAHWMVQDGVRVPAHYGAGTEAEYRVLRDKVGLVDLSFRDRLDLLGEDRHRFLNGQVTCEIKGLEPGQGVYGFFVTAKGRIEADTIVFALEDRLRLELPSGTGPSIRQRLEKYVIVDRVEIQESPETAYVSLLGPSARPFLEKIVAELPEEVWHHRTATLQGHSTRIVRQGGLGQEGFTLWAAPEAAEAVVGEWVQNSSGSSPQPVGYQALDRIRVEAGIPWFGSDFGPENLPQETGLTEAVSFTKGCYLGQEVVARLHYRGQVSRAIRQLEITAEQPPAPGTELFLDEKQVGTLTSVVQASGKSSFTGLGILKRKAFEGETLLQLGTSGTAAVRPVQEDS